MGNKLRIYFSICLSPAVRHMCREAVKEKKYIWTDCREHFSSTKLKISPINFTLRAFVVYDLGWMILSFRDIQLNWGDFSRCKGSNKILFIPLWLQKLMIHGSCCKRKRGWQWGDSVVQDQNSMRFENCCHTSIGRCLMSSNSIPMTLHHGILGSGLSISGSR